MAGQHAVPPSGGRDQVVISLQLRLNIPKDIRQTYPAPINYDAINVARELMGKWERGEMKTDELLELADDTIWTVTR